MEIKVLGMGCPKCNRLEKTAREAVSASGITAKFSKVKDIDAIMAYGVAVTPALVINDEVKCSGRVPSKKEITQWLADA
jgi:small redox-active disulfide protein 2